MDVTRRMVLLRLTSSAQSQNKLRVVRLVLPLSKSVGGTWTSFRRPILPFGTWVRRGGRNEYDIKSLPDVDTVAWSSLSDYPVTLENRDSRQQ